MEKNIADIKNMINALKSPSNKKENSQARKLLVQIRKECSEISKLMKNPSNTPVNSPASVDAELAAPPPLKRSDNIKPVEAKKAVAEASKKPVVEAVKPVVEAKAVETKLIKSKREMAKASKRIKNEYKVDSD
jgi:hypothetical protein